MDAPVNKPRPERDATDESLLAERKNLDQAIDELATEGNADADELVEVARQRADTVLESAREEADNASSPVSTPAEVASQRKLEDEALAAERAAADERLAREREEQARVLAALLPLERQKTDRHLLSERARSDDSSPTATTSWRSSVTTCATCSVASSSTRRWSSSGVRLRGGKAVDGGGRRILRNAARMNRLVGDLLDVVSIEAGSLAIEKAEGDAAALLADAAETFATAAAEKGVVLEVAPVAGPLVAAFDHDRMLQVLVNLVSNALKFTPRGGHVLLGGERRGAWFASTSATTARAFLRPLHEAVFERFRQVNDRDRRGLGLGLYISQSLVEAHGGRIWVESAPGAGSTFHVELPA